MITEYYVTGIYNSGVDRAEIELSEFKELNKFCELIIKLEGSK